MLALRGRSAWAFSSFSEGSSCFADWGSSPPPPFWERFGMLPPRGRFTWAFSSFSEGTSCFADCGSSPPSFWEGPCFMGFGSSLPSFLGEPCFAEFGSPLPPLLEGFGILWERPLPTGGLGSPGRLPPLPPCFPPPERLEPGRASPAFPPELLFDPPESSFLFGCPRLRQACKGLLR